MIAPSLSAGIPPPRFSGSRLRLNIDTEAVADAAVELSDADGKPVPGFDIPDCRTIIENSKSREVAWQGGADLSALRGSTDSSSRRLAHDRP